VEWVKIADGVDQKRYPRAHTNERGDFFSAHSQYCKFLLSMKGALMSALFCESFFELFIISVVLEKGGGREFSGLGQL
jgi:hypothetical protein